MQINYIYTATVQTDTMYYVHQDRLGNYDVLTNDTGVVIVPPTKGVVGRLAYDVWGNRVLWNDWTQRMGYDSEDTTHIFRRGFTGHEHLGAHGIINMNGRMYDPNTATFFSPDPFVQAPFNTQSFNRYAYCLNNPLMYTDPSGELWQFIIPAIYFGAVNWGMNGAQWNSKGLGYFAVGFTASFVSAGIGSAISSTMPTAMGFWQGAGQSALTAGVSASAGGLVSGFGNSLVGQRVNGQSLSNAFGAGIKQGVTAGFTAAVTAGIIGGIDGGINARKKDLSFWTGTGTFDLSQGYSASVFGNFEIDRKTVTGRFKGTFEDVNVFESKMLGSIYGDGGYAGVTIPERGIIVGDGVFSSGVGTGQAFMQHEYGHILQYRMVGQKAYYSIIGAESLISASMHKKLGWNHHTFWTETWANHLAKNYFGSNWIGGATYPTQNISKFNLIRLLMVR